MRHKILSWRDSDNKDDFDTNIDEKPFIGENIEILNSGDSNNKKNKKENKENDIIYEKNILYTS